MAESYTIPKQALKDFLDNVDYLLAHRPITNITKAAMRQQLEDFRAIYINIPDTHQHLWGVQESSNSITTVYCTTCDVTKQLGKSYTKIFSLDKSPAFCCASCGNMVDVVHLYAGHLICGECSNRYNPDYILPETYFDSYPDPVEEEDTHQHDWHIRSMTDKSSTIVCDSCNATKTFDKLYTPTSDLDIPNPFSCVNCRTFSPLVYSHGIENLCPSCFSDRYGPLTPDIITQHTHVWILESNERWFVCAICGTPE